MNSSVYSHYTTISISSQGLSIWRVGFVKKSPPYLPAHELSLTFYIARGGVNRRNVLVPTKLGLGGSIIALI